MKKTSSQGRAGTAADTLLRLGKESGEAVVQDSIARWLDENGLRYSPQYRTPAGMVDIHLEHRRVMMEVKRQARLDDGPLSRGSGSGRGGREESAYDRLGRCVDASRRQERLAGEKLEWRGVVTDGRRWWVWEWPAAGRGGEPRIYRNWNGRILTRESMRELAAALRRDYAGREWVPPDPSGEFEEIRRLLEEAYAQKKSLPDTRMQRHLWLEQLKAGGNHPSAGDEDGLFTAHTLLTLISRFVAGMPMPERGRERGSRILHGFAAWAGGGGSGGRAGGALAALKETVDRYDWSSSKGDVLRSLYMHYVGPGQRRSYGEYYTPDWLAEKMCADVIDDAYIKAQLGMFLDGGGVNGILDPACGSGTFLYHAARRLVESEPLAEQHLNRAQTVEFVCRMINGMDIHPVAVEMSIANMCRILGSIDLTRLRVWQGDSLLLRRSGSSVHGAATGSLVLYSPGGTVLELPRAFLSDAAGIDRFVGAAQAQRPMPHGIGARLGADDREALRTAYASMRRIVTAEGSGVWAWYIRNQAAPMLLSDGPRMGRIVSNPPWVTLNRMSDKARAGQVAALGCELGIYAGGKRATGFDIASAFVLRCTGLYLDGKGGRAGWVLPRTAMRGGGQWKGMRDALAGRGVSFWDLGREPFPKQTTSSAMIVGGQAGRRGNMEMYRKGAERPEQYDSWADSASRKVGLRRIAEGGYAEEPSAWLGRNGRPLARNGATLFPASLVRIRPESLRTAGGSASFATQDARHGAWRNFGGQEGSVPAGWVRRCLFGKDLYPYCLPTATPCIIPMTSDGRWSPQRRRVRFWGDASAIYDEHRGRGKATPRTLEDNLDFQGKLTSQFSARPPLVVYNKVGSRVYASAVSEWAVVENGLYRVPCAGMDEAHFLSGLLNADALQDALSRTKENDNNYDTYLWRKVPMPRYDRSDGTHRELAALAMKAQEAALEACGADAAAVRRADVLRMLREAGIAACVDAAVRSILPGHAAGGGGEGVGVGGKGGRGRKGLEMYA